MPYKTGAWGKQEKSRNKSRLEYFKKYQRKHPSSKDWAKRKRKLVIEILGNKCIQCGFSDYRALQIDHINGGGRKEILKHGMAIYNLILKSIQANENKYQLLCANCNFIKRYTHNELKIKVSTKI